MTEYLGKYIFWFGSDNCIIEAYKNDDNLILEMNDDMMHLSAFINVQSRISKNPSTGILTDMCYICSFDDRLGQYILKNFIKIK